MKKKIVFLIALLAVILSVGYGVKADTTCSYDDSKWPSTHIIEACEDICDHGVSSGKKYTCKNWCESKAYGKPIDKDCYCLKQAEDGPGNQCYRSEIISMLKERKVIENESEVVTKEIETKTEESKAVACQAIANCFVGTDANTAQIQEYNGKYNDCMSTSVSCDTPAVCSKKLCEAKYKNSTFCEVSTDPEIYCQKRAQSEKDPSYSYGAGASGTKGTIKDDLDYISKITVKNCFGFGEIVYYTSLVIKVLQITAPIILIIWASIDLFKSVMGNDEKKIMEMRKPIIQRFVSAAAIFLVPWIVSTIVNNFSSNADWLVCWKNNRYSYARTDDEYEGSGYVNSVHDKEKEKTYINYSCVTMCHGKNITNCSELCKNMYWESSINCYNAGISGKTDTESTEIARTNCYDDFAEEAVKIIKEKSQNQ